MFKLVEECQVEEILDFLETQGAIGVRIGAYLRCYRTKMSHISFWSQKEADGVASVVSKVDGNVTVVTTDKSDFDEIREFITVIGCDSLFMSCEAFEKCNITPDRKGAILCYEGKKKATRGIAVSHNIDLRKAFDLFGENRSESIAELDYLPWLSDFTYKRNRNSDRGVSIDVDGEEICFAVTSAETEKNALISGVVTDARYRKQGYASALVTFLADELKNEGKSVYIMTATDENKNFYENNGFICAGRWGICDRMM